MRPLTLIAVLLLLLALPVASRGAKAQEAGKTARIGMLGPAPADPLVEAFKQGLRELGYVEGRNLSIESRWTEGRTERLPGLAADLVRLKVDVIVASSQAAVAAKHATTTIPIVMPIITDPVRLGLVASLASYHPSRPRSPLGPVQVHNPCMLAAFASISVRMPPTCI